MVKGRTDLRWMELKERLEFGGAFSAGVEAGEEVDEALDRKSVV